MNTAFLIERRNAQTCQAEHHRLYSAPGADRNIINQANPEPHRAKRKKYDMLELKVLS
ncbi:MAG TPA: hypothetical protein P5295_06970 [Spirochaetota bacterium]|nr:hypothetical protein [Spirochaetota bacterium]